MSLMSLVDLTQKSFLFSFLSIAFNPLFWNIVARNEYRKKTIASVLGPKYGCYALGLTILLLGFYRDGLYTKALMDQPKYSLLPQPLSSLIAVVLFAIGQTFVLTSTWALGITGTYLGDYFGILMDHRVEGFPFNVLRDPMYVGSTMCFAATALWFERPAGLLLTLHVHIVYYIALKFEGPFTDMIYANRAASQQAAKKKDKKAQ